MSIDFHYEVTSNPRMSYRIAYPGMGARIESDKVTTTVVNISSTGIALGYFASNRRIGDEFTVDILINNKVLLAGLRVRLVHIDKNMKFLGCEYVECSRSQEKKLDIFILKLQKYEVAKYKRLQKQQEEERSKANFEADLERTSVELDVKDFERTGVSIYERENKNS